MKIEVFRDVSGVDWSININIPEHLHVYQHLCENLKSCVMEYASHKRKLLSVNCAISRCRLWTKRYHNACYVYRFL